MIPPWPGEAGTDVLLRNKAIHVASLALTKTADGLIDPKLVLSWALNALGAPQAAIGLLVPVREALAMLPQLWLARWLQRFEYRKRAWSLGGLIEAVAVAGIAWALMTLDGAVAGWAVVALIAVFALGRSLASVSYKDVLGKTVESGARGKVPGMAGSLASAAVLGFGAALAIGVLSVSIGTIIAVVCVAAGLWLVAAGVFMLLDERPSEPVAGAAPSLIDMIGLFGRDRQLAILTLARICFAATALAPPFVLLLAGSGGTRQLGVLGAMVIASSLASILGSTVWGVASDMSSRRVLVIAGAGATALFGCLAYLASNTAYTASFVWLMPIVLFLLMLAYQGIRLGRSTQLVDMAPEALRAQYTAVSNTAVGLLLLTGGLFGAVVQAFGLAVVFGLFSLMCAAGVCLALCLNEVQRRK